MIQMTIEIPEGVLRHGVRSIATFLQELSLAAAVRWYEMKHISQGRGAEIGGSSSSEFIEALGRSAFSFPVKP